MEEDRKKRSASPAIAEAAIAAFSLEAVVGLKLKEMAANLPRVHEGLQYRSEVDISGVMRTLPRIGRYGLCHYARCMRNPDAVSWGGEI